MRIRPITISAAFAVGLVALPLSIAKAQSDPPPSYHPPPPSYLPCSPFPLEWPFCAVGAILTTAAIIITAAGAHASAALLLRLRAAALLRRPRRNITRRR
jgi:hypothetical protein